MEKTEKHTAEDIIATLTVGGYANHGEYLYDAGEVKDAMHEFAAQELADYKARLEEEFQKFKTGNHVVGIDYLIELIDKTDLT